jgi:hypothetical protein
MRHVRVGTAAAVAAAGGYAALYRLGQTWGATDQERQQVLAGDELLPDARAWTTHAITIAAPAPEVWPWLVQMGWGRAGWYTYRWVDRLLFPANGPSADRILPEYQGLREGDRVPDGPPAVDCWFTVERLEPGRLLVLRSTRHLPASWRQRGLAMKWIWSWQLDESSPGRTRVLQRSRMRLDPWWFERAFLAAIVPADLVMARSHLRGLRDRVEGPPRQRSGHGASLGRGPTSYPSILLARALSAVVMLTRPSARRRCGRRPSAGRPRPGSTSGRRRSRRRSA